MSERADAAPDRAVVEHIERELGASVERAEPLLGGSSAQVWRLDMRNAGGQRAVVLRRHRDGELSQAKHGTATTPRLAAKEFAVLGALAERGFPVASPLMVDPHGQWLVTDFVAGSTTVDPADVAVAVDHMATLLAELHHAPVSTLGQEVADRLEPLENPAAELPQYLPDSDLDDELRDAVLAAGPGSGGSPGRNTPSLVHGDFWPGNIVWKDGRIAALIDWEDATVGDPLADLATARVELSCAFGVEAAERFTAGYLARMPKLDLHDLPLWECYCSGAALSSMHLWGLDDDAEAAMRATTTAIFDRAARDFLNRM